MKQRTLVLGSAGREITQLEVAYVARVVEFKGMTPAAHRFERTEGGAIIHRWSVQSLRLEILLVWNPIIDATYVEIRAGDASVVDNLADELARILGALADADLVSAARSEWRVDPGALTRAALGFPEAQASYAEAIHAALTGTDDVAFRHGLFAATLLQRSAGEAMLRRALQSQIDQERESRLKEILATEGWGLSAS